MIGVGPVEVSTIERVIQAFGNEVAGVTGALVPMGTNLALSFVALSVLFMFYALLSGGQNLIVPVVRFAGTAYATLWAVRNWP